MAAMLDPTPIPVGEVFPDEPMPPPRRSDPAGFQAGRLTSDDLQALAAIVRSDWAREQLSNDVDDAATRHRSRPSASGRAAAAATAAIVDGWRARMLQALNTQQSCAGNAARLLAEAQAAANVGVSDSAREQLSNDVDDALWNEVLRLIGAQDLERLSGLLFVLDEAPAGLRINEGTQMRVLQAVGAWKSAIGELAAKDDSANHRLALECILQNDVSGLRALVERPWFSAKSWYRARHDGYTRSRDRNVLARNRNVDRSTWLTLACAQGFTEMAELLLDYGANWRVEDCNQQAALHAACHNARYETVCMLLRRGADPAMATSAAKTVLSVAMSPNFERWPARYAAYVNPTVNRLGSMQYRQFTELRSTRVPVNRGDRPRVVRLLLSALTRVDSDGTLVLRDENTVMMPIGGGEVEVVRRLIRHVPSCVHTRSRAGPLANATTLIVAVCGKTVHVPKLLLATVGASGSDAVTSYVNETDDVGATALHYAVGGKCADIAALLLEHGARVDQPTKRGQTALMGAAQQMSVDLVDLLLVHGADVNRHDENLVDALSTVAFHFGNAVEELVLSAAQGRTEAEACAERVRTKDQYVLLVSSCYAVMERLLKAGADPNHVHNHFERTPLMLICGAVGMMLVPHGAGHERLVRLLRAYGAKVNLRSEDGLDAVGYACKYSDSWTVRALTEPHLCAATVRDAYGVETQHGMAPADVADVNERYCPERLVHYNGSERELFPGETMLHAAICAPHRMHRAQIVETLLERGADPNAPTTTGKSNEQVRFFIENDAKFPLAQRPLHQVVGCSDANDPATDVALIDTLVVYGKADIDGFDGDGWTPLEMACDLGDDCEHVITALLARGANMHKQCDDEGVPIGTGSRMTALHRAAQADWPKVLALLRGAGGDINVGVAPTVLEVALRYESHASVEEILSTSWATGPACLSGPALAGYADNRVGWSTLLLLAFEESDDSELRQRRQRIWTELYPDWKLDEPRSRIEERIIRAEYAAMLLDAGADPNVRVHWPHAVAEGPYWGDHAEDASYPDADRCITPLMVACVWNNVPLVRTLLAYGADPELRTPGGSRALEFTLVHGSLNALAALRDHYAAMRRAGTLTGALVRGEAPGALDAICKRNAAKAEEAERERQCRQAVDDLIRNVIVDSLEGKGSEGSEGSDESDESEGGEDSEGGETTINHFWPRSVGA